MIEHEKLQVVYWTHEERARVALRIDEDIFILQKKERTFREIGLLDLRVFEEIDMDVCRLSQIKRTILSADFETLEANRSRYLKYV